jgi:NitT/TauT family transport system permease protein
MQMVSDAGTPTFWLSCARTLGATLLALLVGGCIGIMTGGLLALQPYFRLILSPWLTVFNALPRIVLIPLLILWFGLGMQTGMILGASLVVFVVLSSVEQEIRSLSPRLIQHIRLLGADWRTLLRHLYLPAAEVGMLACLRTAMGLAFVGVILGEYLGGANGLGYRIAQAESVFNVTEVFAGIGELAILILPLDWGGRWLYWYRVHWRRHAD